MNPERWKRVVELYERARGKPEAEQDAILAGGEDPEIVAEVRRLLSSEPPDDFVVPPGSQQTAPGPDVLFGGGLEGTRVGDFRLVSELGRGGMGVVYLAEQVDLERQVAVKVLPLASLGRQRSLERFRLEAKTCSTLDHPNLAGILAYGEGESTAWYAMRYVDGHDLGAEIENQRARRRGEEGRCLLPPFDDARYLTAVVERLAELGDAVQHAHDRGVVHRDIKPQNVMIDRGGSMHLVDFGLARDERFGALSVTGEIRGTPSYMSPEQVTAAKNAVDHRTDIYSLGIVLYELLGLERAYDARTSEQILLDIVRRDPKPIRSRNPRVARDLAIICEKSISKSASMRYGSARAFADDLGRFLRHEAIVARPPTPVERATQFVRRHRRGVSISAIVLVTAFFGAVLERWRELREVLAGHPRVSVLEAVDATTGETIDGRVAVSSRPMDAIRDAVGAEVTLGEVPVDDWRFEPGRYRIVVRADGYAPAELTRTLEEGAAPLELSPRLVPLADASSGMKRFEDGALTFGEVRPIGCLYVDPDERSFSVPGFWVDEAEVTNREFLAFLDASGHPVPDYWRRAGYRQDWRDLPVDGHEDAWADLPVVGVSWFDARAFAEWHGKRLITHLELELASGRTSERAVPFRDDPTATSGLANVGGPPARFPGTWPDRYRLYLENALPAHDPRFRQEPGGLFHAYGNVDELTESLFVEPYRSEVSVFPSKRIYYGACWDADPVLDDGVNVHTQIGADEKYSSNHVGFRCARSIEP